jgi:hypothetical protein
MRLRSLLAATLALFVAACGPRACGRSEELPIVQGRDGRTYRLRDTGLYKAYFDLEGRLQILEYDANGDGHPEQIDHHEGDSRPRLTELDRNSDGRVERWEHYENGRLVRAETSRTGGRPDTWSTFDGAGLPATVALDTNGDGKPDRTEAYAGGRLLTIQVDGDADGRVDRWQDWTGGVLRSEDLDTDADGRADRRLEYGRSGEVRALTSLPAPSPAAKRP